MLNTEEKHEDKIVYLEFNSRNNNMRKSKINKLYSSIGLSNKNIFGFKISMNNLQKMILRSKENFFHSLQSLTLTDLKYETASHSCQKMCFAKGKSTPEGITYDRRSRP